MRYCDAAAVRTTVRAAPHTECSFLCTLAITVCIVGEPVRNTVRALGTKTAQSARQNVRTRYPTLFACATQPIPPDDIRNLPAQFALA